MTGKTIVTDALLGGRDAATHDRGFQTSFMAGRARLAKAMASDSIHQNQGATKGDLLGDELIAFLLEEFAAAPVRWALAKKH